MTVRTAIFASIAAFTLAALAACREEPPADVVPPHDSFVIQSKLVPDSETGEARPINVYLPRAYSTDLEARFPVLYMPDGGIAEDFPHIANTIDDLIGHGVIPPMLVVGIENTVRRRDLSGPTTIAKDREVAPVVGGSAAFRAFLRDELMPEIERRYRVNDDAAIVGESLAGLFVIETFLLEPTLFDTYIAFSPSLWWNDHELVRRAPERVAAQAGLSNTLYLSAADETDIYPHTDALAAVLGASAPTDLTWTYEPRRDLEHQTIFRAMSPIGFKKALGR